MSLISWLPIVVFIGNKFMDFNNNNKNKTKQKQIQNKKHQRQKQNIKKT
jgi:hypothetical protein